MEVGFEYLADTYEQPFHRVDFTASQKLGEDLHLKSVAPIFWIEPLSIGKEITPSIDTSLV